MFICPKCNVQLTRTKSSAGIFWNCPSCNGRSATISFLRKNIPRDVVNHLWQTARSGDYPRKLHCPACNKFMAEVPASGREKTEYLDVCTVCQFVWFDLSEYDALPVIQKELTPKEKLPTEAREKLALVQIDAIREEARGSDWGYNSPDEWWQWVPGLLGMPIEQDYNQTSQTPLITWSLALLITIISTIAFFNLEGVVQGFGLIPANFLRYAGLTLLSSFFLHGGIFHLIGNMYFLLVFGDNVESWLGKWRYILLLLCATLAGDIIHIIGDPSSTMPCIGASGGISGIITFYALTFPRVRLGFLVHFYLYFRWIQMPAYALFIIWILLQLFGVWTQLTGISNVSSLAHLGGVGVGIIFWLIFKKI